MVVKGELELRKRKKADLLKDLQARKFTPWSELEDKASKANEDKKEGDDEDAEEKHTDTAEKSDYDYLLGMPMWNLTFEKVEELKKQLEEKKQELTILIKTSIESMWDSDLQALSAVLDDI